MINLPLLICIYMQRMHTELLLTDASADAAVLRALATAQPGDELYNERWSLDTFSIT